MNEEQRIRHNERSKKWKKDNPDRHRAHTRKAATKYYAAHPERVKEANKKWYAANKEQAKETHAEWRKNNPETYKKSNRTLHYKRKYGLTIIEYEAMVLAQKGRCAICSTNQAGGPHKRWHIDHCHKTNTIRRLLCNNCNRGLGFFKDDIAALQSAIAYLKEFS